MTKVRGINENLINMRSQADMQQLRGEFIRASRDRMAGFFCKGRSSVYICNLTTGAVAILLVVQDAVVHLLMLWCQQLRGGC